MTCGDIVLPSNQTSVGKKGQSSLISASTECDDGF